MHLNEEFPDNPSNPLPELGAVPADSDDAELSEFISALEAFLAKVGELDEFVHEILRNRDAGSEDDAAVRFFVEALEHLGEHKAWASAVCAEVAELRS